LLYRLSYTLDAGGLDILPAAASRGNPRRRRRLSADRRRATARPLGIVLSA
jgi:hypothetical protein